MTEATNEFTPDTLKHGGLQERRDVLLSRLDGDDRAQCLGLLAESLAAGAR